VMYEPFKSMKPNMESSLEQALEASNLTLSQFERMTAWTLAQIKRHSDFVEDQLEAATHLHDPANMLQFFQEQFAASQNMHTDMARALFELSHEFHDELNALAHAYQDSQRAELPPGAQWVIDCLQQSLQASQHTWRQAQQAAHASAQLTQQAWAQHPTRKTGKRQR